MNISELDDQLQAAQQRLVHLQQSNSSQSIPSQELQGQAIAELSIALEELNVAVEELYEQNEELHAARYEIELERQLYQELFDFAPDGYLVTDNGGTIREANCRAETLFKVRRDKLIGKPFVLFVAEGDRPIFHAQLNQLSATNSKLHDWELSLQPRTGKPFAAAISLSLKSDRASNATRLLWSIRDLSDRVLAEQKIREQAALLDIATDAILVRDPQEQILFWNKGAERIYGWTAEEAVGKTCRELLCREAKTLEQLEEAQKTAIAKGDWRGELHKVTKFGQEIIVESRWTLVRDEAGNPKFILTVDTDITEKKQLEAQFLRTQRLESLGTLASGIAHDLNNILTPILAGSQLLRYKFKQADECTQHLLKLQENSAKRGADLVKQVLSFSRGWEGQRAVLRVSYLLDEVQQIVQETFPKAIEIQTRIRPDLWNICGDVMQLHQVLLNLCLNARDAMPDGGMLELSAKNLAIDEHDSRFNPEARVGSYTVITVSDTGIGISPDIRDRIFEPFFTTKESGKGMGLGLSIAIGIVKSHEGFIEVCDRIGGGTQFKIFLPATEIAENANGKDSELPRGNGELILVVDDEAAICETSQGVLETYGYRVLTASDGIEAIAQYAQHKHDIEVVLMDLMMPSMGGPIAIRYLHELNPEVKIIATSGLVSGKQLAVTEEIGVKTFLSKPYTSAKLLKTVNEVLAL
jgi:two-component system, cell cycle sensor histidine kinase and response regulator CckA